MAVTLKGIIKIDAAQAQRQLKSFDRAATKFHRRYGKDMSQAIAKTGRFAAVLATVSAVGLKMGLDISGTFDVLNLRLRTVEGSAVRAEKSFKDVFNLFVRSPLHLEPLIQARVLLTSFGVVGAKSLKSVGNAAAIMGRDVTDIALAVGSMHTRALRRLGVNARQVGDSFKFNFRDKTGKSLNFAAKGIDNARQAVLKIFDLKFGGGLEELARTWPGLMSTFGGASKAAIADLMIPLKNQLIPLLANLNDKIIAMIDNNRFEELGAHIKTWVMPWTIGISNLIRTFNTLTEAERSQLGQFVKIAVATVVVWKLGFIKPMLSGLRALAVAHAATSMLILKSMAVIGAAAAGAAAGKQIFDTIQKGFDRQAKGGEFFDGFLGDMAAEFKDAFNPKNLLPAGVRKMFDAAFGEMPDMDLPAWMKSDDAINDLEDIDKWLKRIAGNKAPLRGIFKFDAKEKMQEQRGRPFKMKGNVLGDAFNKDPFGLIDKMRQFNADLQFRLLNMGLIEGKRDAPAPGALDGLIPSEKIDLLNEGIQSLVRPLSNLDRLFKTLPPRLDPLRPRPAGARDSDELGLPGALRWNRSFIRGEHSPGSGVNVPLASAITGMTDAAAAETKVSHGLLAGILDATKKTNSHLEEFTGYDLSFAT